jgi:LruC domain-containing protein
VNGLLLARVAGVATALVLLSQPASAADPLCDPAFASVSFAPARGEFAMLLFEDNWPQNGDLDFNDQVVAYNFAFGQDEAGHTISLLARFRLLANIAGLHNGLYLHLPISALAGATMVRTQDGISSAQAPVADEHALVIPIVADTSTLRGSSIDVLVHFAHPVDLDVSTAPFDLFIARTDNFRHQIHLPTYGGTERMDRRLFGTENDGSSSERHFVNRNGLPFALHVPQFVPWPQETVAIDRVYPDIVAFAASGGTQHTDWYLNNVVLSLSVAGLGDAAVGAPTIDLPAACPSDGLPSTRVPGTLWTWGEGGYGQLGTGTLTPASPPVHPQGLSDVVAIVAGANHSLALKADRTVWAWGNNFYGQVADGDFESAAPVPTQILGLSGVKAIGGRYYHGLAVQTDGTVWTWGLNQSLMLGDGTSVNQPHPVRVPSLTAAIAVDGGLETSLALREDGTVWTWGGGDSSAPPSAVVGVDGIGTLDDIVSITAGAHHSLALRADGIVFAWGSNLRHVLGDGVSENAAQPTPVRLALTDVVAIASGTSHNLALKSDGTVWVWGDGVMGQLGLDPVPDDCASPNICSASPRQVTSLPRIVKIGTGDTRSFAVSSDGTLWGWGDNTLGALGASGIPSGNPGGIARTPVPIPGIIGAAMVTGGASHTVVLIGPIARP